MGPPVPGPPAVGPCKLSRSWSMLYRGTGQHESASNHLASAATMFRDMDMRAWLEKAKAKMNEGSR
jgi:hypothetical protein